MPLRLRYLVAISVAMLALRVTWVLCYREIDSDAYGHFFISIATRKDPSNLAVHWVWLPLPHFLGALLSMLGVGFRGIRLLDAVIATFPPFLLADMVLQRTRSEEDSLLAGALFAVAPLTTYLGQSAQPETLFLFLLTLSCFFAVRERYGHAGVWLAVAGFVRYEAWGAALALVIWFGVKSIRARQIDRKLLPWALVPALAIGLYIVFRWWTDGQLLLFFRGTHHITSVQVARKAWTFREVVSFPIVMPAIVFGPALLLVPLGARRAFPRHEDRVVPIGLAAFLLLSYYGGASHAGERYLVSLVPFVCAAIATGASRLARRRPRAMAAATLAVFALTMGFHLRRSRSMALAWEHGLAEREAELDRLAR